MEQIVQDLYYSEDEDTDEKTYDTDEIMREFKEKLEDIAGPFNWCG